MKVASVSKFAGRRDSPTISHPPSASSAWMMFAPDHTEAADDDRLTLRHSLISSLLCGPRPNGAHDRQAARTVKPAGG